MLLQARVVILTLNSHWTDYDIALQYIKYWRVFMIFKKGNVNKGMLILLISATVLAVFLIIYQQKIIRSLKAALSSSQGEKISVDLGELGNKLKDKKGAFVAVNYDKDTLMGELVQIKAKLAETEGMLRQAQEEKSSLEEENAALNKTINGLKDELRLWEGKINSLDEKKLAVGKRSKLRELNKRIGIKVQGQREIDI
jgi:septal ring factor EnvC (AmiA/AmiB activator)